jgi:hypothetical protein
MRKEASPVDASEKSEHYRPFGDILRTLLQESQEYFETREISPSHDALSVKPQKCSHDREG